MNAAAPQRLRFERFELQLDEGRLLADGMPVALGQRAFNLLALLAQRSGHLVTKDALLERVWPNVIVEENTLQGQVSALRKILGEHAITTVPRRGYRFTLDVTPAGSDQAGDAPLPRHNLPQHLTTFIGRESDVAHLTQANARLLTLTGTGGCGKTRLALQVAAQLLDRYPDGVWVVELAALTDGNLVAPAIAGVLGIAEVKGESVPERIAKHLSAQRTLIVLDNAEHLLDACAQMASDLLRRCAQVAILATSREPLGVAGEQTYRVPSLAVPDPNRAATPAYVSACESVRLFIERARLQRPHFQVTAENAPAWRRFAVDSTEFPWLSSLRPPGYAQ